MDAGTLTVYRGCTPVVDAFYGEETDDSPMIAIINALAEAAGVDPLSLPPLYDYVDPDAINTLFDDHKGAKDAETLLSFRVDTWNVFVRADGHIRICDATKPTQPAPIFDSNVV